MKTLMQTIPVLTFLLSPLCLTAGFAGDIYEDDNMYNQASVIVINDESAQLHDLHSDQDEDWIQFYGLDSVTYQVEVNNPGSGIDPYIKLYNQDGVSLLDSSDDYGPGENETLLWPCNNEGVYFAQIGHVNTSSYGDENEYQLELITPDLFSLPSYLTGTIMSRSAAPVSRARIKVSNSSSGSRGSGLSLSNGSFIVSLEEGVCIIEVYANGYNSATATGSVPGNVNIALNTIPVAIEDVIETTRGGTAVGNVLKNDQDGDGDPLVSILVTDVSHGSLNLKRNGEFTYTHNGDDFKIDSFTYHVNDGRSISNIVRVTIFIDQVYLPFLMLLKDSN